MNEGCEKNKENIRENTTDPIYLVVLHFNFTKKVGRKKIALKIWIQKNIVKIQRILSK